MRVAYLHGFLGSPAIWGTHALPGHGDGPVRATWRANIEAVATAIGEVDAVVGYSLGARVATALVALGFVPRAVLISVNPGIDEVDRPPRRARDAGWARMLREDGLATFVAAWEAQPLFATQERVGPERRAARRARRLTHDPEQLARSLEVMGLAEMPDYRHLIDERFALIAGADDPTYVGIARALPAPLELIADAGHDPTFEQPAATAAAIERALAPPRS